MISLGLAIFGNDDLNRIGAIGIDFDTDLFFNFFICAILINAVNKDFLFMLTSPYSSIGSNSPNKALFPKDRGAIIGYPV